MCRCRTQPNALCPHVEISTIAVVVWALAWLKKNQKNNNNNNQEMNVLAYNYVSWRLTTLAKLSVDVSHVFSHALSRKGLQ